MSILQAFFEDEIVRAYAPDIIGAVISGIVSVSIMLCTLCSEKKRSKKALEESRQSSEKALAQSKEESEKALEENKEFNRVSQLPYLNLKFIKYEADEQGKIFWFTVQNAGNGAALEINLQEDSIPDYQTTRAVVCKDESTGKFYTLYDNGDAVYAHMALPVGQSDCFALREHLINPSISDNPNHCILIRLTYKDTYYNNYKQTYKISIGTYINGTSVRIEEASLPKLLLKGDAKTEN